MTISELYDGESALSALSKWNSTIGFANDFDTINTLQEKTISEIQTLISNATLIPHAVYHITDLDVYFRAITASTFESKGVRKMLVPATYEITTDSNGNVWKSSWDGTSSVSIDDLMIYYGQVFKNLTGSIGTGEDGDYGFDLDSTNWELIDRSSYSNYEYTEKYYGCTVDWASGNILSQWDSHNNIVYETLESITSNGYNSLDYCDWNWYFDGIISSPGNSSYYTSNIFGLSEVVGFRGFANNIGCAIEGNNIVCCYMNIECFITSNTCTEISGNSSGSGGLEIQNNIVTTSIKNNTAATSGTIVGNIVENITGNSSFSQISYNILPFHYGIESNYAYNIRYNYNIGVIAGNASTVTNIISNRNDGEISSNSITGDISYNSNNGEISDNSGTGNVTYNINNGYISGLVLTADVTDTIVNKE